VIGAFGAIDVPHNLWPALLPTLFQNISSLDTSNTTKVASLEALGYMCDAMKEKVDDLIVNQILGSIIEGMRNDRPDEIRLAAITALNNSIEFTDSNFEKENERNALMTAICEATQSKLVKIRERAFECCATVAEFHYDKLQPYVETLYNLTMRAIQTDESTVGMQALEFWTAIAIEEAELFENISDGIENSSALLNIIKQASPTLIPLVLECMTKQEEDNDDENAWNISAAAAVLLESIASIIRDEVVPLTLPFIIQNINNSNWRFKEAAILAFGEILDGPSDDKIGPLVREAMPVLLTCLQDRHPLTRESTAWTIGKICQLHWASLGPELKQPMVESLSITLGDRVERVISRICFAFHAIGEACFDQCDAPSNFLSNVIVSIIPKLFAVATRQDLENENLANDAFEALNKMIQNSAIDSHPFLIQLLHETLNRLEQCLLPNIDIQNRSNLQAYLCTVIAEIVFKLTFEEFGAFADRTMQLLLQVFQSRGASAHEDAFLAIGNVVDNLKENFIKYMPYLHAQLLNGLNNLEEHQVCAVAIGVVGDCCRALGASILPYCDEIMKSLLTLLQSQSLKR
jgi:importin subunit beta-1